MKSFFTYFKGREAFEKTVLREANPEKSPSTSPTMGDDTLPSDSGAQPSAKSSGSNTDPNQKSSMDGRKHLDDQAIILELGDLVKRIPPEFLCPGEHELARELRFGIDEVANNIAQGKATIPLNEIVKQCPEIFRDSIVGRNNIEIFFPWHKLAKEVDRLRRFRSRAKPGSETLGANASKKENPPSWSGKSASESESVPVQGKLEAGVPSCPDTQKTDEDASKASQLGEDDRVGSTAEAEAKKTLFIGESEAKQMKTRIAELLADRQNLLLELANIKSELERVRIEATRLPTVKASLERAERQFETLHRQLQEAIAAKQGLERRLAKAEGEVNLVELLRNELEAAVEGREHAVKALELVRAEMHSLRETNAEARTELVVHAAEIEKAKGAADARVRELEQHIVDLNSKLELLTQERELPISDATLYREHHAKLIASLKLERDDAFQSRDELQEEMKRTRDEFQRKVETLITERDALKREKVQFNSQMDQLRSNHKKQIDFLNGDTEKRVAAMNRRVEAVNAEREKLVLDLKSQREQFNAEIEELRVERIALIKLRDEAIAHARETRGELENEIEKLKRGRDPRTDRENRSGIARA